MAVDDSAYAGSLLRERGSAWRRRFDWWLAGCLFIFEIAIWTTVWGPQPVAWLWVAAVMREETGSAATGLAVGGVGLLVTLVISAAVLRRVDHAWRLVRRAAGHDQRSGAIEATLATALVIAVAVIAIASVAVERASPIDVLREPTSVYNFR